MKKLFSVFKIYNDVTGEINKILLSFYVFLVLVFVVMVLLGLRSCDEQKKIKNVQCFMGESVLIHDDNYEIIVNSCRTLDEISYLNKKGETINDNGNFIAVEFIIKQLEKSNKNGHKLDENDFKLKDHTGAHIPLNDILGLVNIDALDIIVNMDENKYYVSDADFDTRNAIEDYNWIGKELTPGTEYSLCVYFDVPEGYKCEEVVMVFEVDFFRLNGGTDIALAFKKIE